MMNKPALIMGSIAVVVVAGVVVAAKLAKPVVAPALTTDQKAQLIRSDSHRRGSAEAKVTVVEFGDYQCPACGGLEPTLEKVMQDEGATASLVFRNFPLPQHANARIGAQAAEAAAKQGKFWEMHDLLYAKQNEWADVGDPTGLLKGYAKQLGLNSDQFAQDLQSTGVKQIVEQGYTDATNLNLQGTPSLFINGQAYTGGFDYASLKNAIDAAGR